MCNNSKQLMIAKSCLLMYMLNKATHNNNSGYSFIITTCISHVLFDLSPPHKEFCPNDVSHAKA